MSTASGITVYEVTQHGGAGQYSWTMGIFSDVELAREFIRSQGARNWDQANMTAWSGRHGTLPMWTIDCYTVDALVKP
jgi:hypothetical protein